MTTGLFLGTTYDPNKTHELVRTAGFTIELIDKSSLKHDSVEDLAIQIYATNKLMPGLPEIRTNLEFDDFSERFPDNSDAMGVLRIISQLFPSMVYCEMYGNISHPSPTYPLSELVK